MNKQGLVNACVERMANEEVKVSKKNMSYYIDTVLGVIADSVASGEPVSLTGFGKFEITERSAREGRNPATGEAIHIEASKSPKFKASSTFKAMVKNA